jgi:hypothetical protein
MGYQRGPSLEQDAVPRAIPAPRKVEVDDAHDSFQGTQWFQKVAEGFGAR